MVRRKILYRPFFNCPILFILAVIEDIITLSVKILPEKDDIELLVGSESSDSLEYWQ